AIDVCVIEQQTAYDLRKCLEFRRVLCRSGHNAAGSARRVVDRSDRDGDGGVGGAVGLAVIGFVSEAVRPVVIERRGVAETAVARSEERRVGRECGEERGEGMEMEDGYIEE